MAEERGMEVLAPHEDDPHSHFHRRRKNLTEEDLDSVADILEEILRQRSNYGESHCRFINISPADLKAMVEAHKKFSAAMDDSKVIVRRFIILSILTGMGGIAIFGWWAKVVDTVKKALPGGG